MKNFINFLSVLIVIIFFFLTINYYFSSTHIEMIQKKRKNIEQLNIYNNNSLPIIENNTKGVIEFNSGYNNQKNDNFKRNFWDLFNINE